MNTPINELIEAIKALAELHRKHKAMTDYLKQCDVVVQGMIAELAS